MNAPQSPLTTLQHLRQRVDSYNERRQRAQVEVQAALTALQEAQQEAIEQFGTADIEQLQALLAQTERENAERLAAFESELAAQEKALGELEAQLRQSR